MIRRIMRGGGSILTLHNTNRRDLHDPEDHSHR